MDLINVCLPGQRGSHWLRRSAEGRLLAIAPMEAWPGPSPEAPWRDLHHDWLSLGGVDLQINGALGLAFPDLTDAHRPQLQEICTYLGSQGLRGFLPTLVTTSVEKIHQALGAIAPFLRPPTPPHPPDLAPPPAHIWGVHLEGPFLNPTKRGAHPEAHLLPLTLDQVQRVLGDWAPLVKVMTLAPELDPTGGVIPSLRSLGITVSLGHSLATAAEANQAFAQGATMVTHAFNAMPGLHHRQPGLLGAALVHPQVHCGVIADGQHVVPTMIQILLRAKDYDQGVFLVSDALAPLGLPDGAYPWDQRLMQVTQGTARLLDGTLAGTTLPLLAGVAHLARWGLCDPERAIALATTSPRRALGQPTTLMENPTEPLLRWHWDPESRNLTWTWLP